MITFIKHPTSKGDYKDADGNQFFLIEVKEGVKVASNHPRVEGESRESVAEAQGLTLIDPKRFEKRTPSERPPVAGPKSSVEQWTEKQGFSALRMLTIKDLEGKLAAAGKESVKLSAIRQWADSLIALFATNPEPRNDWPEAPFSFDETVQEAVSLLV